MRDVSGVVMIREGQTAAALAERPHGIARWAGAQQDAVQRFRKKMRSESCKVFKV